MPASFISSPSASVGAALDHKASQPVSQPTWFELISIDLMRFVIVVIIFQRHACNSWLNIQTSSKLIMSEHNTTQHNRPD